MRPVDPPFRPAPRPVASPSAPRRPQGSRAGSWPAMAAQQHAGAWADDDAGSFADPGADDLRPDWQSGAASSADLLMSAPATTFYDAHLQRMRGQTAVTGADASPKDAADGARADLSALTRRMDAADKSLDDPAVVNRMFAQDAPSAWAADAHLSSTSLTPGAGAETHRSGRIPSGAAAFAARTGAGSPARANGGTQRPPAFLRRAPRDAGRDPAPSRLTYRLQRLWLTPLFRRILGVGMPVFMIAFTIGTVLADPKRHAAVVALYDDLYTAFQDRPEFRVGQVAVQDASPEVAHAIETHLAPQLPASSLRLDLEAQRTWIEALDAIASAELRVLADGTLEVRVTERVPAIIWRSHAGLELLDQSGARVAMLTGRAGRPDLPLIAGEGASAHVTEALTLIATASPLTDRLRGLVRVGDRRWDVVLDRNQRIMLPETGARAALERALALHQAQDLLARDVSVVDLRMPTRPTVRLAEGALNTLYSIRNQ